jgi:putative nucleotidyltransferase with HDIG domain
MDPILHRRKVLLVATDIDAEPLIAEPLRQAGSEVQLLTVDTLAAALEAIVTASVDALILDLGLPGSSGIETLRQIQEAAPKLALIILSEHDDPRTALRLVQEGVQDYLVKGRIDGETVVRSIGYAIERKSSEWTLRETGERLRADLAVSETVAELSRMLVAETRSLEEVARLVLERAVMLTRSGYGYVSRTDPESGANRLLAATGMMPDGSDDLTTLQDSTPFPMPTRGVYAHLWGVSLNTRQPFLTNEPATEELAGGTPTGHVPVQNFLSVPVVKADGVVGEIAVANADGGYESRDALILERLASLYAVAIVQNEEHESLRRSEESLRESNEDLAAMILDIAGLMGGIVETRDPYTQGHQVRVAAIAQSIATEMGRSEDDLACVGMAALLHDIGKLSVPAEILSKPGELSDMETALIREHPARGHDLLAGIAFPWPIADIVLQHHERWDGSGYPNGIHGKDILVCARILAVADVLEAMSSHRPYRASLGPEAAVEEIATHPERYCPEVSAAVAALYERGELGL